MRIAVCIKQVPVVSAMQFDPDTKTLKREGVPCEVSAFDIRALIKGVELKAAHGGEVVVLTLGPPQAREALAECLALGADRAIHVCDRAFAGSDTLATAVAPALGMEVVERDIARTELYVADEAFFCGSGYEITPILSVDRFPLGDGKVGPITQRLYNAYMDIVRGANKRYSEWRTPVYRPIVV